ncbi:MAG TPA: tRNA uridine-5-carboxymethylaminomethyl(34) synthesis GTPase MnmE [Candidatus Polarisedimenticolia bacterium]
MSDAPSSTADTIVAISSPPGRGGIGVVRLSGPDAAAIAGRLFRPAATRSPSGTGTVRPIEPAHGEARFGRFVDREGEPIDKGYLLFLHPPRSFTGEPTAELWAHGSPAVLRRLVECAVLGGARPATPGEFTLRAFLNGRIDATRAEAIRDLIEARTSFQAKVALDQVMGRIAREVDRLKGRLATVVARVEASIEFSEEAEAERFAPEGGVAASLRSVRRELQTLAGTYDRGRRVRDGAVVALVGAPNVGKSSLFNRLLEEERAIVTPIAGTTRDLLEESLDLGGIPVCLTDTAGLHESRDEAEAEAVRRARLAIERADLLLVVLDWSRPIGDEERTLLRDLAPGRALVLLNKCDLPCRIGMDLVIFLRKRHGAFEVSARSGEGMNDLRSRLREAICAPGVASREELFLTNVRHRDLVQKAALALEHAEGALGEGTGEEYLVLDLNEALGSLGEITGPVGIETIYETIFSTFCIGK